MNDSKMIIELIAEMISEYMKGNNKVENDKTVE